MSEPTGRGTLQSTLDPTSSSKQTMLDWLRIHHPKTVIRSKANKEEVANIVREKQPNFFTDATSGDPPVTSKTKLHYPPLEHLRVSSPVPSNRTETSQSVKRSASQDLELSHPHKRVGIDTKAKPGSPTGTGSKIVKRKKNLSRPKLSKIRPHRPPKPVVSEWIKTVSTSPQVSTSIPSAIRSEDDKHELNKLKQILFGPLDNPGDASPSDKQEPLVDCVVDTHYVKSFPSSHQSNFTEKTVDMNNPNPAKVPEDLDLIEFSDTKVFEVGNLVTGRDIPVIQMQQIHSPSSKKTGVDVFQEAQRQEERIRTLEERLAHLETSLEAMEKKSSRDTLQDLQQEQLNANALAHQSSLLEQATKGIAILNTKLNNLDVDAIKQDIARINTKINNLDVDAIKEDISRLNTKINNCDVDAINLLADLDIAHSKIRGHARALMQLLGPGNDDLEDYYSYDSSDENDTHVEMSICDNDQTPSD